AAERESVGPAFERGNVALERFSCGVPPTRVFVAFVLAQPFLHVSRRRVDRRHDRAGERVRALPRVDGAGAKGCIEVFVEDASHALFTVEGCVRKLTNRVSPSRVAGASKLSATLRRQQTNPKGVANGV